MFTTLRTIAKFESYLITDRTAEERKRAKVESENIGFIGNDRKDVKKALKLYAERDQMV